MARKILFALFVGWLLTACGGNDAPGGTGPNGGNATVTGTVVDQRGLPVEGVVVSDGLLTTLTDGSGNYALGSDLSKRRFVQVTIPAAYEIPVKNGIPQFWRRIPEGATEFRADFTLQARRKAASRYTVLMTADPQIRPRGARYDNFAFHSIDMYEDMCRDLRETAASITDRPVYGIALGDLVHNDMSLYPTYCAGIADFDFPVFSVIGNHDHVQNVATDREAVKKFEEYLGPTCYSVELGELHFIFLDNIVMKNNTLDPNSVGAYSDGLSDEAYSWLCNDLKYVDKNRTVMLCAHSSMFRKPDSEPADRDRHGPDYASRLAQYRCVHSWAGHSHINFNYAYSAEETAAKFPNVESHILARSTGALWLNESMSSDGTPRGYMVVEVDGETVSWYYKPYSYENDVPSGLDRSHQIRVYAPGAWYSDGYVYANVWNHDARWGAVRYTDSGKSGVEMKRVTVCDGAFVRMADHYNSVQTTATFEPFRTSHMFRILPTAGVDRATVEATDRFGERYTTTVTW